VQVTADAGTKLALLNSGRPGPFQEFVCRCQFAGKDEGCAFIQSLERIWQSEASSTRKSRAHGSMLFGSIPPS
jgi:hypothetical protein